jgi:nucleotide-binding universal stress UspA family protein
MLGSTSRALVEFAPCPVVVVRPGGRALPPA